MPRRRVDLTNTLVPILTKASGKTATASITAPVKFGLGGLRYVFDVTNDFHAYVLAEGGKASIEYKPRYFVNGTDVTDSLATYGITLGSVLLERRLAGACRQFGGAATDVSLVDTRAFDDPVVAGVEGFHQVEVGDHLVAEGGAPSGDDGTANPFGNGRHQAVLSQAMG